LLDWYNSISMLEKPIFFSWQAIRKATEDDIYKIYKIFKRGEHKNFPGYSFLLSPKALLAEHDLYKVEVVQYIYLAARRNYFDAKYMHNSRLSTYFVQADNLDKIKQNRLLDIVGTEIIFKHEEIYGN